MFLDPLHALRRLVIPFLERLPGRVAGGTKEVQDPGICPVLAGGDRGASFCSIPKRSYWEARSLRSPSLS